MPVSFPSSNFGTNFNFLKSSILLIDTSIGSRKYKGYTDSEQLLSLVLLNPSGGNAVEHLKFLEEQLEMKSFSLAFPSPTSARDYARTLQS